MTTGIHIGQEVDQVEEPTVYLFGAQDRSLPAIKRSQLLSWLSGETVEMTPDLARQIRQEFQAQERYRVAILDSIQRVQTSLLEKAGQEVKALEYPSTSHLDNYWRGFGCGQYGAYCEAAQAMSEIAITSAMAVEQ